MDVRIGYPTEHLASDAMEEVNHPMFSTSVGLILKGFEQNVKTKEPKKEEKPEFELEEKIEEEKVESKKEGKSNFMNNLKKVFTDIFDEDDAEM